MKFSLCGRAKCCPQADVNENGTITITDDYGGKVQLTKDNVKQLYDTLFPKKASGMVINTPSSPSPSSCGPDCKCEKCGKPKDTRKVVNGAKEGFQIPPLGKKTKKGKHLIS